MPNKKIDASNSGKRIMIRLKHLYAFQNNGQFPRDTVVNYDGKICSQEAFKNILMDCFGSSHRELKDFIEAIFAPVQTDATRVTSTTSLTKISQTDEYDIYDVLSTVITPMALQDFQVTNPDDNRKGTLFLEVIAERWKLHYDVHSECLKSATNTATSVV